MAEVQCQQSLVGSGCGKRKGDAQGVRCGGAGGTWQTEREKMNGEAKQRKPERGQRGGYTMRFAEEERQYPPSGRGGVGSMSGGANRGRQVGPRKGTQAVDRGRSRWSGGGGGLREGSGKLGDKMPKAGRLRRGHVAQSDTPCAMELQKRWGPEKIEGLEYRRRP